MHAALKKQTRGKKILNWTRILSPNKKYIEVSVAVTAALDLGNGACTVQRFNFFNYFMNHNVLYCIVGVFLDKQMNSKDIPTVHSNRTKSCANQQFQFRKR